MSQEVWQQVYARLADLAQAHRTTLIFVNTRRMAERAARHLSELLGDDQVMSHHGSMAKELRLKAEQRLKVLLQQYPKSPLRPTVEDRLHEVQENLAMHNLQIARFYYDVKYSTGKGGLKGAQSRLKEIVDKYPCFSYNDEVFYRLASTYQAEEEPDEAAKYYQKLVQEFPESEYIDKAREQLNIIGAPIPEKGAPNPCAKRESQSFMGNLLQQVSGRADVTVNKNGILISKDGKEGTDLIDEALRYNGSLPASATPEAPTQRSVKPAPAPSVDSKPRNANGAAPASAVIKP